MDKSRRQIRGAESQGVPVGIGGGDGQRRDRVALVVGLIGGAVTTGVVMSATAQVKVALPVLVPSLR